MDVDVARRAMEAELGSTRISGILLAVLALVTTAGV